MDELKRSQFTKENIPVYYNYKDRVFRLLFSNKKRLLEFYNGLNGTDYSNEEEFTLKLSEAFEDEGDGCLELTVRVININFGYNQELFSKCQSLYGYAYFVAAIRQNLASMELRQAVEKAVEDCIEKNILREFLIEQKAEVIAMSIYEYNEEYVRKTLFEDGKIEGETRLIRLMQMLMEEGKEEELKQVIMNQTCREQLYIERNL